MNNAAVKTGIVCRDRVKLIRHAYLGFTGDLAFFDTQGTSDPSYDPASARAMTSSTSKRTRPDMSFLKKRIDVTISLGTGQFGESGSNTVTLSGLRVKALIQAAPGDAMPALQPRRCGSSAFRSTW
ncbi:MAG: hypothetical protein PW999_00800 [Paraburkholderia tropica]|nr:hypothetical protein [Paraburkholderia tropica]